MNIYFSIWVFFLHFLGDFVAQNRYIADNKSKSFSVLSLHVICYIIVLGLGVVGFQQNINTLTFCCVNYFFHFITDLITSQITKYFWNKKNIYAFYTTIGFDQFVHSATLLITCKIFFGDINAIN